jgi:hypothetical protein
MTRRYGVKAFIRGSTAAATDSGYFMHLVVSRSGNLRIRPEIRTLLATVRYTFRTGDQSFSALSHDKACVAHASACRGELQFAVSPAESRAAAQGVALRVLS